MSKVVCDVCGKEIDSRGISGHMKTHKQTAEIKDADGGVITYPDPMQTANGPENDPVTDPAPDPEPKSKSKARVKRTVKIPKKVLKQEAGPKPIVEKWHGMFGEIA